MARPLRIEFAGALYHVTARGNAREDIYLDNEDRQQFLALLDVVVNRHDWYCHAYCHAYCLMDNHYHLLIETARAPGSGLTLCTSNGELVNKRKM